MAADNTEKDKKDNSFMMKLATLIVDKRKGFYLIFIVLCIFCVLSMNKVKVNNDLTTYLPDTTETRRGLDLMDSEFTTYGSARILICNVTFDEAQKLADQVEKMDRRVRKTRALLLQGLVKMMETHDIQDISVKELTELVDINRGTFYLHYDDIYDMLHKVEDEMFREFNEIMEQEPVGTPTLSSDGLLLEFFRFLDRHRDLARVMIGPHGDLTFVNRLKDQIKKRTLRFLESAQSDANYEYLCSFIITGCVGVVETWLKEATPQSPEEMAGILGTMLMRQLTFVPDPA